MTSRRAFIKQTASTGLLFVGCAVMKASAQPERQAARRVVTVKGRRLKTVDVHAHCAVAEAIELRRSAAGNQAGNQPLLLDGQPLADRTKTMDAQGIEMEVLSINPNWYDVDRDLAVKIIDVQNERMAAFCTSHSDRFAAFASVALQFPDLAAQQLERAMKTMGFRGAAIGGSVAGLELADPKFHPFWAKAEELGAVVFIHPQGSGTADFTKRLQGNGMLGNVIGNPLETTIALSHLIFEGTLDRFPGLKIVAAHGGGYLPSYMNRSDNGCKTFPAQCKPGVPKNPPTSYVKRMYYDSLVFTSEALRHLVAEVGVDRIVVGTDYPFPWVDAPVDHVLNAAGLSDADRVAILQGNATKLLGLKIS
jgi:aminocarboxymuconate-semialdehyde decarboxylase